MIEKEVLKFFSGKNTLVTGGTGLIGRQIVSMLRDAGADVTVVSLDKISFPAGVKNIFGDLTDYNFCKKVTKGVDFVFHVAGIKGSIDVTVNKPASFFVPLLMMNSNLLEACRFNKVQKTVYTSSIGAYPSAEIFRETDSGEGPPMDMFPGWAKRMAEMQIKAYKIQYGLDNFAIVRPCNVYGPGDNFDPNNAMVIPSLMYRIYHKENPVVIWGDGTAVRDFAYSRDVAEGIILALYHGTNSGFVNLGSGEGVSIKELVETLHSFIDFDYYFDTSKPSGFHKRIMDITLAKKMIDYSPTTSLLDGLKETWNWFIKNQDEYLKKKNYFKD
ncbi:MAG: NAD-dependent epimerase/dehydratase family protein [Candidatus Omnitrophota bacterium]